MEPLRVLTAAEQVAGYLRRALQSGAWGGRLPGGNQLAGLLGVGRNTAEAALRLLEADGVLAARGPGRRREVLVEITDHMPTLRVAILDLEPPSVALAEGYMADLLHRLGSAGYSVFYADKCLQELRMEVGLFERLVRRTRADAWVVCASSREVLEWFAAQPMPTMALFGRRRGLPIAGVGPDHVSACVEVTRRLIELGHKRIVMLARRMQRLPGPGAFARAFLGELAAHGIQTGPFHLPDWNETNAGFRECLEELFQVTPPTALFIDEAPFLIAALQFLGRRGLRVPEDVSLVCTDPDPAFVWCQPEVAHVRWDSRPVVQRILRWAANVARGKDDRRQTLTPAEFVEGGTVGPVMG